MSVGGFGVFRLLLRLFGSGERTLLTRRPIQTGHSERGLLTRVVNMSRSRLYVRRTSFIIRSIRIVALVKNEGNRVFTKPTTYPQQSSVIHDLFTTLNASTSAKK